MPTIVASRVFFKGFFPRKSTFEEKCSSVVTIKSLEEFLQLLLFLEFLDMWAKLFEDRLGKCSFFDKFLTRWELPHNFLVISSIIERWLNHIYSACIATSP